MPEPLDIHTVWDICLKFEYNEDELIRSLNLFFQKYKNKSFLDCSCGFGFATLGLYERGYDITFADGSELMLTEFKKRANSKHLDVKPLHILWENLGNEFHNTFDVLLCRGNSLIYANAWDKKHTNNLESIKLALKNFYACLKPDGLLYLDTTCEKNLQKSIEEIEYPPLRINGDEVKLYDKVILNKNKMIRLWTPTIYINGTDYTIERRSYYLSHEKLDELLLDCGFHGVEKIDIPGEHYDVFIARA